MSSVQNRQQVKAVHTFKCCRGVMVEMACREGMERMERREIKEIWACQARLELPDQALEELSTRGGDEQPAPVHRGQSYSMREQLGVHFLIPKVVEQIACACQETRTI